MLIPGIECRQIRPVQVSYSTDAVGCPFQRLVMKHDHDTVTCHPHIGLDVAIAQLNSALEGRRGVLRPQEARAAMGEANRMFE